MIMIRYDKITQAENKSFIKYALANVLTISVFNTRVIYSRGHVYNTHECEPISRL